MPVAELELNLLPEGQSHCGHCPVTLSQQPPMRVSLAMAAATGRLRSDQPRGMLGRAQSPAGKGAVGGAQHLRVDIMQCWLPVAPFLQALKPVAVRAVRDDALLDILQLRCFE